MPPEPESFSISEPIDTPINSSAAGFAMVGREDELSQLSSILDRAISGEGQSLAITGEPGIGKSLLVSLLKEQAQKKICLIASVTCTNLAGATPLWAWQELFGQLPDSTEIVSQLKTAIPDVATSESTPDLDTKQFKLFSEVISALRTYSADKTLVICIDDLQWADTTSQDLFAFAASRIEPNSILLASGVRTNEANASSKITSVLSELGRLSNNTRLEPALLDPVQIRSLAESLLGHTVTNNVAEQIAARSKGVPLFVRELAYSVDRRGQTLGVELSGAISEVIGAKLASLKPDTQAVLSAAAVLGGTFNAEDIDAVLKGAALVDESGMATQKFLSAINDASAAGAISSDSSGLFQFSHPLYAEVARDSVPVGVSAAMHSQAGALLEEKHGARSADYASQLAWHYRHATTVVGTEKVVHFSLIAGQSAIRSFAWAEALEHFENVRKILGNDSRRIELAHAWLGIGRARFTYQSKWGNSLTAREIENGLAIAFDIFLEKGEIDLAIDAASQGIVAQLGWGPRTDLAERALELADDDSPKTARLLTRYGDVLFSDKTRAHLSDGVFKQAFEMASRHKDQKLQLNILRIQAQFRRHQNKYSEILEIRDRALPIMEANPDVMDTGLLHVQAGIAECSLGHFNQGERSLNKGRQLLANLGIEISLYHEAGINIELARAEFSKAVDHAIEAQRLSEHLSAVDYFKLIGEAYTGDIRNVLTSCLKVITDADSRPFGPTIQALFGHHALWIARLLGDTAVIHEIAKLSDSLEHKSGNDPITVMLMSQIKGKLASELGDSEEVLREYERLLPQRGTFDMSLGGFAVDILLGDLLIALDNEEQAIEMYASAYALTRGSENVTAECESAHAYATALLNRGSRVDIAQALNILHQGMVVTKAHGFRFFHDSMHEMLNRATQGRDVHPGGLTSREVDVVRLIAAGKSNPQIADELFISLNTVLRHVSNIFGKLGVSNRTEAGIRAVELDLIEKV